MSELEDALAHCDGHDCTCAACGECECACGCDWRSEREVELEYENKILKQSIANSIAGKRD